MLPQLLSVPAYPEVQQAQEQPEKERIGNGRQEEGAAVYLEEVERALAMYTIILNGLLRSGHIHCILMTTVFPMLEIHHYLLCFYIPCTPLYSHYFF